MTAWWDLVLPVECAGCGTPGHRWCRGCELDWLDVPAPVKPRIDAGVRCWALGPFDGVRRSAILAGKARLRRDHSAIVGLALARGIATLAQWGELPDSGLCLVPAPSRRSAARMRGGDPVARYCRAAVSSLNRAVDADIARSALLLQMGAGVRDSVGLSVGQRAANLAGRVRPTELAKALDNRNLPAVVIVDDVLTTGATAAESVRTLAAIGIAVATVLVVAAA